MKTSRYVNLSVAEVQAIINEYVTPNSDDNDCSLFAKSFIKTQPTKYQVAFILFIENYTTRTIAAYLGVTHSTVQTYIKKMLLTIRENCKSYDTYQHD